MSLENLNQYSKLADVFELSKENVMQTLLRNYKTYMEPEDIELLERTLWINQMRPLGGAFLGGLMAFGFRYTQSFKQATGLRRRLTRTGLFVLPVAYTLATTPTPSYTRITDCMYIKYYKPVSEDIIKAKKSK